MFHSLFPYISTMVLYNEITSWFHARLRAIGWKCLIICYFEGNINARKWKIEEFVRFVLHLLLWHCTSHPLVSYIFVYLKYYSMSLCLFQGFKNPSKISSYPCQSMYGLNVQKLVLSYPIYALYYLCHHTVTSDLYRWKHIEDTPVLHESRHNEVPRGQKWLALLVVLHLCMLMFSLLFLKLIHHVTMC